MFTEKVMPQTEKKKILFVYPTEIRNSPIVDSSIVHPIGLFFISAYLKSIGYITKIIYILTVKDGITFQENHEYQKEIAATVTEFNPDYIGLSFRNLMHDELVKSDLLIDAFCVALDKPVIDFLRHISQAPIIGGGSALTLEPKMYMEYLNLDYAIIGEGEIAFGTLVQRLEQEADVRDIPGLVYQKDGQLIVNPNTVIRDYENLPKMDVSDLKDYKELFYDVGGFANIQTKRGCDFGCIFCNYPYVEGKCYRLRKVEDILDEIENLKNTYGVEHFFFVDSVFSTPVEHSANICKGIIERKLNVKWTGYINPRGVTKEVLEIYKQSGCEKMIFGADALCDSLLSLYQKGFTQDEVRGFAQSVIELDMNVEIRVILGGPGETDETIDETIRFCEAHLKKIKVNFQYGMLFFISDTQKEIYRSNPLLYALSNAHMGQAIMNNDMATLRKFHYFFEKITEDREAYIEYVFEKIIAHNRNIIVDRSKDKQLIHKIVKKKMKAGSYW